MRRGCIFCLSLCLIPFWSQARASVPADMDIITSEQVLTLDEAMLIAEQNSPTMRKVWLSRERSRQSLVAQKASTKAQLSLNLDPFKYSNSVNFDDYYSRWYNYDFLGSSGSLSISQPIVATNTTLQLSNVFGWQQTTSAYQGTSTDSHSFKNDLYLSVRQPLFTYNSQKMTLKQLEMEVEEAEIYFALSRLSLERTVTNLFYSVYMAQLQLSISEEELKNTRQSRDMIADKVEMGMAADMEIYQADLNLSSAQSGVRNRKVSLENAKIDFKRYIGIELNTPITVTASIEINDTLQIDEPLSVQRGLANRMELREREISLEYQKDYLIQVKDYNDFDASLSLSIGITGNNETFRNVYDKPSKSPSVGISLNIPIYDWGERKARIKAQEASLQSSRIDLESEQTDIQVEIGEICRNIGNYKSQIEIERQNRSNAELAYDISLEKYANGDLTAMDLNLYQTQLSNRRIALLQAQINYKLALLNLKIATLYDVENQRQVITVNANEIASTIQK